jgi:hypothetical protein
MESISDPGDIVSFRWIYRPFGEYLNGTRQSLEEL